MRVLIILGIIFWLQCSAWIGAKIGWYLFFEPSSMNDAEQIRRENNCDSFDSSDIGVQLKCKAAYDYIRKNRENH